MAGGNDEDDDVFQNHKSGGIRSDHLFRNIRNANVQSDLLTKKKAREGKR